MKHINNPRKRLVILFIIFLSVLQVLMIYKSFVEYINNATKPPTQDYHTVADKIIKIENKVTKYKPDLNVLNSIIEEVQNNITISPKGYSKSKAKIILRQIGQAINDKNFEYKNTYFFSSSLLPKNRTGNIVESPFKENKNFLRRFTSMCVNRVHYDADCDTLSIIYLSVADALNLPIEFVSIPEHALVRFKLADNKYQYWETTLNISQTVENICKKIKEKTGVQDHKICIENYFRIYNKTNILSFSYRITAAKLQSEKRVDTAIKYLQKSIEIYPGSSVAYYQLAAAYQKKQENYKALDFAEKALKAKYKVFQNAAKALRITLYMQTDQYLKTISEADKFLKEKIPFKSSLEVNSVLIMRGIAYTFFKKYDKAISDFNMILKDKNGKFFSLALKTKKETVIQATKYKKELAEAQLNKSEKELLKEIEKTQKQLAERNEPKAVLIAMNKFLKKAKSKKTRSLIFFIRGTYYNKLEQYKEAINDYKELFKLYPEKSVFPNLIGSIYYDKLHDYKNSFKYFSQAMKIDPNDTSTLADYAEACLPLKPSETIKFSEDLIKASNKNDSIKLAMFLLNSIAQRLEGNITKSDKGIINFKNVLNKLNYCKWSFSGTLNFIIKTNKLSEQDRSLYINLIEEVKNMNKKYKTKKEAQNS